jgi:uncharacterized protein with von Willebrand factor type A (vWA) domain
MLRPRRMIRHESRLAQARLQRVKRGLSWWARIRRSTDSLLNTWMGRHQIEDITEEEQLSWQNYIEKVLEINAGNEFI